MRTPQLARVCLSERGSSGLCFCGQGWGDAFSVANWEKNNQSMRGPFAIVCVMKTGVVGRISAFIWVPRDVCVLHIFSA